MAPARVQAWPVPAGAWQAQLRSVVFGMNTPYSFTAVEGLDLPQIMDGDTERATADGMIGGVETTASRDLIFNMLVHPDMFTGSAKAVLMQALKAAFAESSDDVGLTLQHPDLGPLLFIGRPRRLSFKVDRQFPFKSQEGVLALFKALDPLMYSVTLQDITILYGTAGTNAGVAANTALYPGVAANTALYPGVKAGAIGGGGGAAGFYQAISPGTATTKPVTRIKATGGPVTGPLYLDRVESNESIILNYNMANGDVLELDHDLHSVLLNGVTNRADLLDVSTSWWSISPGTNTIHFRTGGPGAGSQAEILYRDAQW